MVHSGYSWLVMITSAEYWLIIANNGQPMSIYQMESFHVEITATRNAIYKFWSYGHIPCNIPSVESNVHRSIKSALWLSRVLSPAGSYTRTITELIITTTIIMIINYNQYRYHHH